VEEFTMSVSRNGERSMSWDKTKYSVSFKVAK
jgi:hypothetical protein